MPCILNSARPLSKVKRNGNLSELHINANEDRIIFLFLKITHLNDIFVTFHQIKMFIIINQEFLEPVFCLFRDSLKSH